VRLGRRSRPRLALLFLGATLGLLVAAPAAQATFHLIKVREVYAGTNNDSYVELQMFAAGQSLLGGHSMTLYSSTGTLSHTSTFAAGVTQTDNQSTVLIGDSNVETAFGVKPDLVDANLAVPAAGGAACWNALGIPADCVAWGNFTGGAALQSATGTSAGAPVSPSGITAGKAIRRTIEPGCPTLLEESDDSDVSLTDLKEVTPAPRNNASAVTESTCSGAPNTAIDDKPPLHSNSSSAEFTYEAPTATSYECRLDAATFAVCPNGAPKEYTGLAEGSHTFQVRGVNGSGPDPSPASFTWTVDTVAPTAVIDSHPDDPSNGGSAAFSFHASETATFQCSLVPAGGPDAFLPCVSGQTYSSLGDGEYTFKVRATDQATNLGAATSFSWEVDNSLADTTTPQTRIDTEPPDPSPSSTASFTYSSNEAGSSFECALDGAAFSPCASGGISYPGLANGPHGFQVRAIDPSANVDPTPAGYSFSVAVEVQPPANPGPNPGENPPASTPRPAAPPAAPPPSPRPASPPQTILTKPAAKTHDRTPSFRFRSDAVGASFECAVDRQSFKTCRSPFTTKSLKPGHHTFSVRAVLAGQADQSPAKFSFKVLQGH
jgi:hypothetical protein